MKTSGFQAHPFFIGSCGCRYIYSYKPIHIYIYICLYTYRTIFPLLYLSTTSTSTAPLRRGKWHHLWKKALGQPCFLSLLLTHKSARASCLRFHRRFPMFQQLTQDLISISARKNNKTRFWLKWWLCIKSCSMWIIEGFHLCYIISYRI